jgi:NAD(P)-dependent dehydrogenase (short-subunit alcohol dehydrogenase family)
MRPLTEQVILITGATDGLGKAVAMHLAGAGATLLLHGRDEARGQQTLEEIRAIDRLDRSPNGDSSPITCSRRAGGRSLSQEPASLSHRSGFARHYYARTK